MSKWNAYDYVIKRVRRDGSTLQYASEELRDNKTVADAAIRSNPRAFMYISERLRSDKELVLLAISKDVSYIKLLPENLRDDEDIGFAAVSKDAYTLAHLSDRLRSNVNIILVAIKRNINVLQYAKTDELPYDVFVEAVKRNASAIQYVPQKHKTIELIRKAVEYDVGIIKLLPEVHNDYSIMSECVKKDARIYELAPYLADDEVLAFSATYKHLGFSHLSERLRANKELALLAISHNWRNIHAVSESLKKDHEVVIEAYKHPSCSLPIQIDKSLILKLAPYTDVNIYLACPTLISDGQFLRMLVIKMQPYHLMMDKTLVKIKTMNNMPLANDILNDIASLMFETKNRFEGSNHDVYYVSMSYSFANIIAGIGGMAYST